MSDKVTIELGDGEVELSKDQIASLLKEQVKQDKARKEQEELADLKDRKLKYINRHGKEVWLAEEQAVAFHASLIQSGGKFLGDQNGNMTPPRGDARREYRIAGDEQVSHSIEEIRQRT